jgi:hypothetical protein
MQTTLVYGTKLTPDPNKLKSEALELKVNKDDITRIKKRKTRPVLERPAPRY